MEQQVSNSQKILVFIFPLSIFIMIFDRLKVYPTVNMSMYRVLQIPILVVIVIFLLGQRKIKFNLYSPTTILLFGFLLSILISTLTAVYQEISLIEARRIIELIILSYVMFFFIKYQWDERNWVTLAIIMMITGTLSGLSVLTDLLGWTNFYRLYREVMPYMRPFGILGEPNYAAGKLGIFLPFAFFSIVNYRQYKSYFKCYLSVICTFLIIVAIFLTGSRMGGAVIVFSIFIFMVKLIRQKRLFLKITIYFITVIMIIVLINSIIPIKINFSKEINHTLESYKSLFSFMTTGEELVGRRSLSSRSDMIRTGMNIFIDYPFFGIGLGNYKYFAPRYFFISQMYYSHNTFITILSELGIIGFLFFIFICIKIISNIYYFYKKSSFSSFYFYLGLSFVNLLIMSFFLHNVNDKYFWGMFIPISMLLEYWKLNKKDLFNSEKENL